MWTKQTDTTVISHAQIAGEQANRGMFGPFWTWHCSNYIVESLTFRRQHADATWHGVQCKGISFFALLTLRLENFTAIKTILYAAFVYVYWTSQKVYKYSYILVLNILNSFNIHFVQSWYTSMSCAFLSKSELTYTPCLIHPPYL